MLDRRDDAVAVAPANEAFDVAFVRLECRISIPREWLEEFERGGALPTATDELRRYPRFHFRSRAILIYRTTLPALPRKPGRYVVLTKNVSRQGICFLHEEQLFPTERMTLWLPSGGQTEVEVVRCMRVNERCYDVGVRFLHAQ